MRTIKSALKHYYKDESHSGQNSDLKRIDARLDQLPVGMQIDVAKKYSDIYLELITEKIAEDPDWVNGDPIVGGAEVRRRANTWLRKVVNKYKIKDIEGAF